MRVPSRRLVGTLFLSAVAVVATYFILSGAARLARRWAQTGWLADWGREERRSERLHALRKEILGCLQAKERVALALVARRISLFEAAAWFRVLQSSSLEPAVYRRILRMNYPGHSDEERLCRKVIDYVRFQEEKQSFPGGTAARLEAELTTHLERYGAVDLPAVPSSPAARSAAWSR